MDERNLISATKLAAAHTPTADYPGTSIQLLHSHLSSLRVHEDEQLPPPEYMVRFTLRRYFAKERLTIIHNYLNKMNLKTLLPFDDFKLLTTLPQKQVMEKLVSITEPRKIFHPPFQRRLKPYEGNVYGDSFDINRIIGARNSFLPFIRGEVATSARRTEITVSMRPAIGVIIFMSLVLGGAGLVCIVVIVSFLTHNNPPSAGGFLPIVLIPFGVFVFGYGLMMISYNTEAQESKAFLKELLQAEENDSNSL